MRASSPWLCHKSLCIFVVTYTILKLPKSSFQRGTAINLPLLCNILNAVPSTLPACMQDCGGIPLLSGVPCSVPHYSLSLHIIYCFCFLLFCHMFKLNSVKRLCSNNLLISLLNSEHNYGLMPLFKPIYSWQTHYRARLQ